MAVLSSVGVAIPINISESGLNMTSGLLGVVVGGVMGVIVGLPASVFFEDRLKRKWDHLRRDLGRRRGFGTIMSTLRPFTIGPLQTSCVIVEGDGENPIGEDAIKVFVEHKMVQLPPELDAWRAEIAKQMDADRQAGITKEWNGPRYAVAELSISRDPVDESPEVYLKLQHSDYCTFLAAQNLDRQFADGTTPRSRYLTPFPIGAAPAFMANSLGVYVAVITKDGKVLFSRRSTQVKIRPGVWNASISEGLSRSIDSRGRDVPELHAVARRGLKEELALERTEYELDLLAFVLDCDLNHWAAVFIAQSDVVTQQTLEARWTRGVPDRWEHEEFAFAPFTVASVAQFMLDPARRDNWAPIAPAVYYLALVNMFGRTRVERTIARLTRDS